MSTFEDALLKRLSGCHAEACKEIEKSLKAGRPIGDAVLDAIEALPASKTRDLRGWLKDWEAWEEWDRHAKDGWRVKKIGKYVFEFAPTLHPKYGPSRAAIAAGAGVTGTLKYVGDSSGHGNFTGKMSAYTNVGRHGEPKWPYTRILITQFEVT